MVVEKKKNGFVIGIDIADQKNLIKIGKLVEQKRSHNLGYFCDDMVFYWSNEDITLIP